MNLFIGSSSIGVFKLFKNSNYRVIKVKAGTAKGLYTNENGKEVIKTITNIKKPINCIVLHFGEVDINFSYYYKVCNSKDKNINPQEFCNEVYNQYSKFIDKIVDISKCKTLIIKGLYPNPVKDEICIAIDHLDFNTGSIAVFDVLGKLKIQKTVLNKEVIKIDTSNLSQGVYLYNIKNEIGKTILNGKFIKS